MGETDVPTLAKADLHNWLATGDTFNKYFFNKVVDRASKKLGPGGILGVVEASNERRYGKFVELPGYIRENFGNAIYLWDQDLIILRGERVSTKDSGSLLVLGLDENNRMTHNRDIKDTLQEARDKNGIIIFNPSYCTLPDDSCLDGVDAIEVHNGSYALKVGSNDYSQEIYEYHKENYNLGSIVTSGGHSVREIGSSWMKIPSLQREDGDSIRESLRVGIKRFRDPALGEEKRLNSCVMSTIHTAKLYTPIIGWGAKSKKRKVVEGIYQ